MSKYIIKRFSRLEERQYVFRGYGRGMALGGIVPGAVGTKMGGDKGMQALEEGDSYHQASSKAGKRGLMGAAGGYLGAKKNFEVKAEEAGYAPEKKSKNK